MVYGANWTVDVEGDHVYSEMNFPEWWWETQDCLPLGATSVPQVGGSHETHLTDFGSDKKA
jgi:hypothetical protein